MIFFFVASLVVSYVKCENPHNLHVGTSKSEVIERLWNQADINHDGHLDLVEVLQEFITVFDFDLSGGISQHEFVQQWHHKFHENHLVIEHIFAHFDTDHNNVITNSDLTSIFHRLDTNGDDILEHSEFVLLLDYIYGNLQAP